MSQVVRCGKCGGLIGVFLNYQGNGLCNACNHQEQWKRGIRGDKLIRRKR